MILAREAETGGIEPRPYGRLPPPCVIRAGRCGHRPLRTFYRRRVRCPCGGVHPKGTCPASLHCVGIRPYTRVSGGLFVGGDAHIAPPFSYYIPGGQSRPPLHTSTGHIPHTQTKDRLSPVFPFSQIHFFIPPCRGPERQRHTARVDEHAQGCGNQKNRPPKRVVCLAGAERLELSTRGFGDRCSTN